MLLIVLRNNLSIEFSKYQKSSINLKASDRLKHLLSKYFEVISSQFWRKSVTQHTLCKHTLNNIIDEKGRTKRQRDSFTQNRVMPLNTTPAIILWYKKEINERPIIDYQVHI